MRGRGTVSPRITCVAAVLLVLLAGIGASTASAAGAPMRLISRGLPAFSASEDYESGDNGDDSSYSSYWTPQSLPGWLAIDLSSVPPPQRSHVMLAWYNDPVTSPFDYSVTGDVAYNLPSDYTIEVNNAPGQDAPPTSGWRTVVTVAGNSYHSRAHVFDMAGANWVRMNVTAASGGMPMLNLDVYDASGGANDGWLILGDSITQDGLAHEPPSFAGGMDVSDLVAAAEPGETPSVQDGGIGGLSTNELATHINAWLAVFPGRYVGLAYGTNDANGCMAPDTFYANLLTAVRAVLAAGKIPVIPTIPASLTSAVQQCGPGLNAEIARLIAADPQILPGPDLWAFYSAHRELISSDGLHPTDAGYADLRQLWADAMVKDVYDVATTIPPPAVATLSSSAVTFPDQVMSTTSQPVTVQLSNSGGADLTVHQIAITGLDASDFGESDTCPVDPAVLGPGAMCTIAITFNPVASGTRTATLRISDSASSAGETASLSGIGVSGAPAVTLSPSHVTFATQPLHTMSPPQTVTVTNSGAAPLAIDAITVGGGAQSDFAQTSTCPAAPATLAARASCTVAVTFTPTVSGDRTASLNITDSAPGSPRTVGLEGSGSGGTGGAPPIAFDSSLGQSAVNDYSNTLRLTTTASASAGTRVVLFVNWSAASARLASVSGGGLTWSVDVQAEDGTAFHSAIASASAPDGLAPGTMLTATFSDSVTSGLIAAASFAGVAAGSPLDATASSVEGGDGGWTGDIVTSSPGDLVLGWSGIDAAPTFAPASPASAIFVLGDPDYGETAAAEYTVAPSAGPTGLAGTWTAPSGATGQATVLAAYRSRS